MGNWGNSGRPTHLHSGSACSCIRLEIRCESQNHTQLTYRYCQFEKRTQVLECSLQWRNIAPTPRSPRKTAAGIRSAGTFTGTTILEIWLPQAVLWVLLVYIGG
eukprot:TRINITY_DN3535_c1_g2_i2.p1 TRINITY_DN3535_c1_g2~~TRINITY_DN3535_c1_g2_i2.p1  ORF type:complete len:104 (-),score=2.11 TRINITY_DN3535_c1_g2_i2:224-535(-)